MIGFSVTMEWRLKRIKRNIVAPRCMPQREPLKDH